MMNRVLRFMRILFAFTALSFAASHFANASDTGDSSDGSGMIRNLLSGFFADANIGYEQNF